jgi:ribonuclease-3
VDEALLAEAEQLTGHAFSDRSLLLTALTHPSYAAEHADADTYDRLEFLGDAVLGFVVSAYVYDAYPEEPEGALTRRKHHAVAGDALSEVAEQLGLPRYVLLGAGASAAGERQRASILENTIEALIGAIYLDGGLDAARTFVVRVLGERLHAVQVPEDDPKSALQQWTQAVTGTLPAYRIVATAGPVHARTFTAEVAVDGRVAGEGSGPSKQSAEKAAAAHALSVLRGRGKTPPKA